MSRSTRSAVVAPSAAAPAAQTVATEALVTKQTAPASAEATRRAVSNPFSLGITETNDLFMDVTGMSEHHGLVPVRVVIGSMNAVGNGKFYVTREGVPLNKGGESTAQTGRADAAYYGLRNLLSRAATRDIDPVTRAAVADVKVKLESETSRADAGEARAKVLAALMLGDMTGVTPAMVATLDPALVAALPADKVELLTSVK